MADVPQFYGIRNTNVPYADLWKPINLPRALAVASVNMLGDKHLPINLVRVERTRICRVADMDVDELYGVPVARVPTLSFDFDSDHGPFAEIATNVPVSPLVVRDGAGNDLRRLDVMSSVVPDASTLDLPREQNGPEISVKSETVADLALSLACSLMPERDRALAILTDKIPGGMDWTSWESVSAVVDDIQDSLNRITTELNDLQSPFLLQSVWRSDDDDLYMDDEAMDAFVWTDMAFARLFLDAPRQDQRGISRHRRSAVRVHRLLTLALSGGRPDVKGLMEAMSYGVPAGREFMVNGNGTNRKMACDRLTHPALRRLDVAFLASAGFEEMVKPERRLGDAVYDAVKELRGRGVTAQSLSFQTE